VQNIQIIFKIALTICELHDNIEEIEVKNLTDNFLEGNMVTLKDVAEYANVSVASVSYTLNNKGKVSPKVRERIQQSVKELNYIGKVPQLGTSKTRSVIRFYCEDSETMRTHMTFNHFLAGILSVATVCGYDVVPTPVQTQSGIQLRTGVKDDGIIIINPRDNETFIKEVAESEIPCVIIGRPGSNRHSLNYVDSDNVAVGYQTTKLLLEKKHSSIVFLNGPKDYTISVDRLEGYKMALADYSIPFVEDLVLNSAYTKESAAKGFEEFYSSHNGFTGIIANSDVQTLGVLSVLNTLGKRIPKDHSLICCGESILTQSYPVPITGVDLNFYEIGVKAAQLVLDIIDKKLIKTTHYHVPFQLNDRGGVLQR
jgi:LacI family transcriptional regulator